MAGSSRLRSLHRAEQPCRFIAAANRAFVHMASARPMSPSLDRRGCFCASGGHAQVLICCPRDRIQDYCAGDCTQPARRCTREAAGRRYQSSRHGRLVHSVRTRRFNRARCKKARQHSSAKPSKDQPHEYFYILFFMKFIKCLPQKIDIIEQTRLIFAINSETERSRQCFLS